jgi:hypothetical protein
MTIYIVVCLVGVISGVCLVTVWAALVAGKDWYE